MLSLGLLNCHTYINLHFIGKSPLDIAAEREHSTVVNTLIEKGALQHLDNGKLF